MQQLLDSRPVIVVGSYRSHCDRCGLPVPHRSSFNQCYIQHPFSLIHLPLARHLLSLPLTYLAFTGRSLAAYRRKRRYRRMNQNFRAMVLVACPLVYARYPRICSYEICFPIMCLSPRVGKPVTLPVLSTVLGCFVSDESMTRTCFPL